MTADAPGLELRIEALTKKFGGVSAVEGVTLRFAPSELVVLIGPNGAGKTTIFNLITGVLSPDAGHVLLGNRPVTHIPAHQRARMGIGRTFQDVRLFTGMTAAENVEVYASGWEAASVLTPVLRPAASLRSDRQTRLRAAEALDLLGIGRLAQRSVENLSYAQQKLVAIARVLAMGAQVLLLDEPASGVDESGREELCVAVRCLAEVGRTVCVVEHNLDVVRRLADRLVFLAAGQVLADGMPDEIFSSGDLADVYFGTGVIG